MGEVTELYPLPGVVGIGCRSASWTRQSPPQSRLVGVSDWGGYRAPSCGLGPSTGRGTDCHTTGDFSYHACAGGPGCLGLCAQGTAGTRRSCAPAPKPSQV